MKKTLKYCFAFVFFTAMVFVLSLSASAGTYEPDTTTSVEYGFDAAECDRTLIIDCIDESGTLLKEVQVQTKRGDEYLANVCLYGYEVVAFESDQGLWETCKILWSSVNYVDYASVMIWYYFRTDLSKDVMTATVTLRKCGDITVKTRHYLRTDYGIEHNSKWFWVEEVDEQVVSYGDPFTSAAKEFTGHYLMTGYPTQIEGTYLSNGYPALISGSFTYTNIKNAYDFDDGLGGT